MSKATIMSKIESEGAKTRKAIDTGFRVIHNGTNGSGGPVLQKFIRGQWVTVPEVVMSEDEYWRARGK